MSFNEDSRVKIPTILHLMKLGYSYLSLKDQKWDRNTNVFPGIFEEAILDINEGLTLEECKRHYDDLAFTLENEDLGRAFWEKLIDQSDIRLIDFDKFDNNSFHVVTELACQKDDEEFRPDITLLINGMPLVFIEVKRPNNLNGVLEERNRMVTRLQNKKFQRFINITQFMIFSNNMEYDNETHHPVQGAFYASPSHKKPVFNYFREEEELDLESLLNEISSSDEDFVLRDTNLTAIKNSKEFQTNKHPNTPTNRICNSLLSRERLKFILKYAITYVNEPYGIAKHIMRYPQMFATKAITGKLDEGIKKGIIWHTQGSGKTALTFYNVKHLTDYYRDKNVIPKFYFIVDRLDLLKQASKEFMARGLTVHKVNSREEFAKDIKSTSAIHNDSGKREITVVNIQKFKDDPEVVRNEDYNLNMQRVYFLDEVHRSYNPKGSFLANLNESDRNAVKIGLTGTPLLGNNYNSKSLFGGYIHKYYYNASISDGYTLRLIREEIETSYRMELKKALEEIDILKGDADKKYVYAHQRFVEPMLDYIVKDFEKSRISFGDNSIGAMVVCDSSDQAKRMMTLFAEKYTENVEKTFSMAAEPKVIYGQTQLKNLKVKSAGIILHDIGSKEERDDAITDFKNGKIDLLFVYNMLLTGFDAKRLKKLYLGRVIKSHNLLQTLTRVNRPYKEFPYGYVVDFADIQYEFDKTNRAYFDELQDELGDEIEHYSNLFKSQQEIEEEIKEIKDVLLYYDTENSEIFTQQISEITKRSEMLEIIKVLNNAKSLYNLIRLSGNYDLLQKLDFRQLLVLSREANNRLALINMREALEKNVNTTNLLNVALEDVIFAFTQVKSEELILADQLKDILRRTRELLGGNLDQGDPRFISLKEELERLFKKKNLTEVTREDMVQNIAALDNIIDLGKRLERKNALINAKYDNDAKYLRIHKRLMEKNPLTDSEAQLFEALNDLKKAVDEQILQNSHQMDNEAYVEKMLQRLVISEINKKHQIPLNAESARRINQLVVKEYLSEYIGKTA